MLVFVSITPRNKQNHGNAPSSFTRLFLIIMYLCGSPALYLYGGNGIHCVQHRGPSSIQAWWVCGEGTRRHSAVSRRYRSNLPLEKLENNVDVCCHASLQSGEWSDEEWQWLLSYTISFMHHSIQESTLKSKWTSALSVILDEDKNTGFLSSYTCQGAQRLYMEGKPQHNLKHNGKLHLH